jgi:hypothetical protein
MATKLETEKKEWAICEIFNNTWPSIKLIRYVDEANKRI